MGNKLENNRDCEGCNRRQPSSKGVIITAVALTALLFGLDLMAPLGVAGGVPYVILVLYGWIFRKRSVFILLATAATILTILGYLFSPIGGPPWVVFINRLYAIIAIWAAALFLWWISQERFFAQEKLTTRTVRNPTNVFSREYLIGAVLLAIIIVSAWGVLSRIEARAKLDIGKSLTAVLDTSHLNLQILFNNHKKAVKLWANNSQIVTATEELLSLPRSQGALANSPIQVMLREWLIPVFSAKGFRGYFIIGADNINLASTRDSNIGTQNILTKQPELLARVWAGETLITLPQHSVVDLKDYEGEVIHGLATMFAVTPIKNNKAETIAILAFRLEPDESFTPVFDRGRFGETSETYAFSKKGLLLSESRFISQLKDIGLLPHSKHSDLHIEIRDPGVDLTKGESANMPKDESPLTLMAQSATAGESGVNLDGYRDYRGVPVLGAWLWDDDLGFGMVSEINSEEAFTLLNNIRFIIVIFACVIIAIFLVALNISAHFRKKIEERDARNSLILASIGEGIFGLDTQGRVSFVNPKACEMLGFQVVDFISQPIHPLIQHSYLDGSEYPLEKSQMNATLVEGKVQRIDGEVMWRKDGSHFPIEYIATPMLCDGKPSGAVISFMDISERKKAKIDLATAKNAAEKANRAKSDFLANMSHEIRTPMNAIIGFSELGLDLQTDPKHHNFFNKIKMSAKSLLSMINDILDFAKIENGKLTLNICEFNMHELLGRLIALSEAQANEKGLKFVVSVDDDVPSFLQGDPIRLHQILVHLVENAIKFTHHGEIKLSVSLVSLSESHSCLRFSVEDTGIGIEEKDLTLLFDAFTQLDTSTTRKYGGTGLGLTIASQLVQLMNGQIEVESEFGRSTAFNFEIDLILGEKRKENPFQFKEEIYPIKHPQEAITEIDRTVVDPLLKDLATLLASSDFLAETSFNNLKICFMGSSVDKELDKLGKYISLYKYKEALTLLQEISTKLNISIT